MTSRPTEIKLDDYGQSRLDARAEIGERCIAEAGGWDDDRSVEAEDRETFASDAISDILTALFGPAGTYTIDPASGTGDLNPNEFALNEARRLVEHAFHSWEGDAEDYTEEEA